MAQLALFLGFLGFIILLDYLEEPIMLWITRYYDRKDAKKKDK